MKVLKSINNQYNVLNILMFTYLIIYLWSIDLTISYTGTSRPSSRFK